MQAAGDKKQAKYFADGVQRGDIAILGRAITLVESGKPEQRMLGREIIKLCSTSPRDTFRLGITGVPGVGKSTFIESFGKEVLSAGYRLAVLAVDPTSAKSKGSILGDKTRMQHLSANENVFIRPSPSGGALGGITQMTFESMLLCEAAGFNYVIIETVGVGQSEVAVHRITDFFLLLMLAGAGDELQGIKRGIMEMADALVITKADSGNEKKAAAARTEFAHAMHLLQPPDSGWKPPVLTCSALSGEGVSSVFESIEKYRPFTLANGYFNTRRKHQRLEIFRESLEQEVLRSFFRGFDLQKRLGELAAREDFDPFEEAKRVLREAGKT